MLDSGTYDDAGTGKPCPPKEALSEANSGGEYEASGSGGSEPPVIETLSINEEGEYKSESGDGMVCPPEIGYSPPNDGGIYEGGGSGGGVNPPDNGHGEDCDCEECCFYTETVPNTIDVGGHPKGEVYDRVRMRDMWYQLLHPYVYPTIQLTIDKNVFECGEAMNSRQFTWNTSEDVNAKPFETDIYMDNL